MKEDLERLDRLLEHRVRLAVCVLLSRYDRLSFSKLKELTDETDGNLGANLKKLEDEGYVTVSKEFVQRKPVSWYAITARGMVSQYAVVCICCSGRSSSPEPMFSLV